MLLSLVSVLMALIAVSALGRVAAGLTLSRPLPDLVAAINEGDTAAVSALLLDDSETWTVRTDWLAATGAVISLSSCNPGTGTSVTCAVRFGNDWFYNQAAPPEVARQGSFGTVLTVEIEGDQIRTIDFPLPAGLSAVEEPFYQWVSRADPTSVESMWRRPGVKAELWIDAKAGEAHRSLLDEYVGYLHESLLHTPG